MLWLVLVYAHVNTGQEELLNPSAQCCNSWATPFWSMVAADFLYSFTCLKVYSAGNKTILECGEGPDFSAFILSVSLFFIMGSHFQVIKWEHCMLYSH